MYTIDFGYLDNRLWATITFTLQRSPFVANQNVFLVFSPFFFWFFAPHIANNKGKNQCKKIRAHRNTRNTILFMLDTYIEQ